MKQKYIIYFILFLLIVTGTFSFVFYTKLQSCQKRLTKVETVVYEDVVNRCNELKAGLLEENKEKIIKNAYLLDQELRVYGNITDNISAIPLFLALEDVANIYVKDKNPNIEQRNKLVKIVEELIQAIKNKDFQLFQLKLEQLEDEVNEISYTLR